MTRKHHWLLVSVLFLPAYFRGELVTSYELLQRRFGSEVKTVASGVFLITRSLADGIRLFATALVIAVVTGVPVTWTVILLGGAMIVYTVRGGASAVIWTDVVQMILIWVGVFVCVGVAIAQLPAAFGLRDALDIEPRIAALWLGRWLPLRAAARKKCME
jgi:Na+/proline symporter